MDNKAILLIIIFGVLIVLSWWVSWKKWERRRDYYKNKYLKSDEWRRKRYVVLKRDNWRCVYCGQPATQVHHKKYSKLNLGKEPLIWLVSVCKPCHETIHNKRIHPDLHDSEIRWNYGFDSNTVRFRDKTQK